MSESAPLWQAPALSNSNHVVRARPQEERPQHLVRWAQQKALGLISEAERRAKALEAEALERGYQEGLERARLESEEAVTRQLAQERDALAEELRRYREDEETRYQGLRDSFSAGVGELALEIGEVLGMKSLQGWRDELWELLQESFRGLGDPPRATVRIGDRTLLDSFRERLEDGFEVVHDPALSEWDLKVQCDLGQAAVCWKSRLEGVRSALAASPQLEMGADWG